MRRVGAAFNRDKIISPVGQYIRSHPVPPIVRQIRPKTTKHFDDDLAAFERDELRCQTPTEEKKRMFKPLPMAEYKSSKVALEQRVQNDKENDMKALPKVFGITPTVEAKVSFLLQIICRFSKGKILDYSTRWTRASSQKCRVSEAAVTPGVSDGSKNAPGIGDARGVSGRDQHHGNEYQTGGGSEKDEQNRRRQMM